MKRRFQAASKVASAALASTVTVMGADAAATDAEIHSQSESVQSTMNGSSSKTRIEQSTTTLEDGQYVTRKTVTIIENGHETVEEEVIRRPADAGPSDAESAPADESADIREDIEALRQDIKARVAAIRAKAWASVGKP